MKILNGCAEVCVACVLVRDTVGSPYLTAWMHEMLKCNLIAMRVQLSGDGFIRQALPTTATHSSS